MAQWRGMEQLDAVRARVQALPQKLADEMLERVQQRTPVRSGYLKSRWEAVMESNGFVLGNDAPYAWVIEFGNETHRPVGMLRTVVMEVPDIVRQIIWSSP